MTGTNRRHRCRRGRPKSTMCDCWAGSHLADTAHRQRAVSKGELVNPESVERYLKGKFGEALHQVRAEKERLASHFPADRLNQDGFHLYERSRPEVPSDERGWGAKGVLDLARIRALVSR